MRQNAGLTNRKWKLIWRYLEAGLMEGGVASARTEGTPRVLEELDGWIKHKLRALLWRQWKRNPTRATNLMRRGLKQQRAWQSASNGHGPWRNGGASHMNAAYPESWFDHLGLVSLLETQRRFSSAS